MFLLVPAHPGFPGQIPQSRKTVVCVCVCVCNADLCKNVTEYSVKSCMEPFLLGGCVPFLGIPITDSRPHLNKHAL